MPYSEVRGVQAVFSHKVTIEHEGSSRSLVSINATAAEMREAVPTYLKQVEPTADVVAMMAKD